MPAPALPTSTSDIAAEVATAMNLLVLRDLADQNGDRAVYRRAFVALWHIDAHYVKLAEQALKAEALAAAQTSERVA